MRKLLFLFLLFLSLNSFAQKKPVVFEQQAWAGYYPQLKFSKHWGLWFDAEIHSGNNYSGFSQAVFRLAATYYNNKKNKFTAGYGYADYLPGDNHKYISIPEHHAWEQYQWYKYPGKSKLMQWIRLEQKFKENVVDNYTASGTYSLTYRIRYNIFYTMPLSKKGLVARSLGLSLGDEFYLYYGTNIDNHLFDQNRIFLGFSYAVNSHNNLVFGLMNMLQEDGSGTQFKDNNVLRISFFQNIGLKVKPHIE